MPTPTRRSFLELLARYGAVTPGCQTINQIRSFVLRQPYCFERSCCNDGHITGSAWVVNSAATAVLLTHHKKLNRWIQLGGHSDGLADPLAVALREAAEESGVPVEPIDPEIFDVDVHDIPGRNGFPKHRHYDVRFLVQTTESDAYKVSDESHDLRWISNERLLSFVDEESVARMARKWLTVCTDYQ